jgi:hypothetical protein
MSFLAKTGGANVDRLALQNIEFGVASGTHFCSGHGLRLLTGWVLFYPGAPGEFPKPSNPYPDGNQRLRWRDQAAATMSSLPGGPKRITIQGRPESGTIDGERYRWTSAGMTGTRQTPQFIDRTDENQRQPKWQLYSILGGFWR